MTAPLVRTEHRCGCCRTLLGVRQGGAVHLKYKDFYATVRSGVVDVFCRRCRKLVTLGSEL